MSSRFHVRPSGPLPTPRRSLSSHIALKRSTAARRSSRSESSRKRSSARLTSSDCEIPISAARCANAWSSSSAMLSCFLTIRPMVLTLSCRYPTGTCPRRRRTLVVATSDQTPTLLQQMYVVYICGRVSRQPRRGSNKAATLPKRAAASLANSCAAMALSEPLHAPASDHIGLGRQSGWSVALAASNSLDANHVGPRP